ncbi:MAG: hypothetical protein K9L84_03420 [Candidatus Omnitrophica bacterium]|nr:hypothetical protein [Candidatus Omnitrophota bacterium]MCF7894088.1 hypothetical protein [Candidatus Omnitrophota bacterium]
MKGIKSAEIVVSLEDQAGALGKITSLLKRDEINIRAVSGWIQQKTAVIRMVTSDNQKAKEVLSGFETEEKEVVVVDMVNEIGQLDSLSAKLAQAGISMTHVYGTTPGQGQSATLVFASDNNDKAIEVISE